VSALTDYHVATSSDGVRLRIRTGGVAGAQPILFVHGFSQSHLTWTKEFAGPLAREFHLVAFDLRGHGWSDKPEGLEAYHDSVRWANDVAAVMAALELRRPVCVGWSYGGRVICDYLATYGDGALAGINFVDAAISGEDELFGDQIGLVGRTANPDPSKSIAATRRFLRGMFAAPVPQDDLETMLAYNSMVPPEIRSKLLGRSIDARAALAALTVPVLFSHGCEDRIVAPAMSRFGASLVPNSSVSLYEGAGHAPFYEATERFDAELADFARRCMR
jgi:non-heme chloroperoxidase